MSLAPEPTEVVAALSAVTPFTAPEALERKGGKSFQLRLGANESLFGAAPAALEAIKDASARSHLYNDPEGWELRSEIARLENVTVENVCLGAGIDDLLLLLARAFLEPGRTAVTSRGSYPTFEYVARGCGATIVTAPYREDAVDLQALADLALRQVATVVYLANPDNPSGSFQASAAIESLIAGLPTRCLLLLDEAYADFVPQPELLNVTPENPQMVVRLRTFSKAHGLAGLRIGYLLGSTGLVSTLEKIRLHFSVNSLAQVGALASLRTPEHVEWVVREVASAREFLTREMQALGIEALPSHTNFVCLDLGTAERANAALRELAERGVFVRKPMAEPLDRCVRVTLAPRAAMERFVHEFAALDVLQEPAQRP